MRNDTSQRKKGTAVFLSVLMVLSVVAMSAAFAGMATAEQKAMDENQLYDAPVIWQGQQLLITDLTDDDFAIRNAADGTLVEELSAGAGGLEIDTSNFDPGFYYIDGSGATGDEDNNFEIAVQNLEVAFESESVAQESEAPVGLDISSIRGTYNATVTEVDDSFSTEELEGIFAGVGANVTNTSEDNEILIVNLEAGDAETYWDEVSDAGNYTFHFEVTDTTAEAFAEIEVTEMTVDRSFVEDRYTGEQADMVNITIDLEGTDQAALQIGEFSLEDAQYYEAGLHIDAGDYDGDIVGIQMNLYAAGGATLTEAGLPYQPGSVTFIPHDDSIDVNVTYIQAHADPVLACTAGEPCSDDVGTVPAALTYMYDTGEEGMLPPDNYRMTLGNYWAEIDIDPDTGNVDSTLGDRAEYNRLTIDPISPPGDFTSNVVSGEENLDRGMSQDEFSDLTVTNIGEDGVIAVDENWEDGDYAVGIVEDAGLAGAIWFLDLLVEDGVASDFGNALWFTDSGIEVTLEQHVPSPFEPDVYATTNETKWGAEPDVQQLEIVGLTTGDYDGDVHVLLNYTAVDGLAHDEPVEITFDVTDAADGLDLPDDLDLSQTVTVTFEQPELELTQISEIGLGEEVEIHGTTNIAPGHEVFGELESELWFADTTGDVTALGEFTVTFDTLAAGAAEGDLVDFLAVENVFYDISDRLEDLTVGADPDPDQPPFFSIDASAPSAVEPDADASLDVTVENVGDETGTSALEIIIDGDVVVEETLEDWEGGQSDDWSEAFDTSEEGEIEWEVNTANDTASGTLTVAVDTDDDTEPADDEDDDDAVPGFGVAVAIVALLSAAMLALRRQD